MENGTSFFDMGGYGGYIWSAYILVAAVLIGLFEVSRRFTKTQKKLLEEFEKNNDEA